MILCIGYQLIEERFFLDEIIISGHPLFTLPILVRTSFTALISLFFVIYPVIGRSDEAISPNRSGQLIRLAGWGALLLNVMVVILFIADPELFTFLQFEDSVVEYSSAGLLFVGAGICLYHALLLRRTASAHYHALALVLLAGVLFVVGMEEVSWFQRIIGFETPAGFASNMQGEFNLHNFDSNLSEEVYYSSAFFLLVLFPFIYAQLPERRRRSEIQVLVPSETIMMVGSMQVAFNFHLWNRVSTEYQFFISLFILLFMAYRAYKRDSSTSCKLFSTAVPVVFVMTQGIFLLMADKVLVDWSIAEYKELFIPIGLLLYSLDMLLRTKKHSQTEMKQSTAVPA